MKQWTVQGSSKDSFDALKLGEAEVPTIKDSEVLVKFKAASLNYRDLDIVRGTYAFPIAEGVIPASDGSGVVEKVGSAVTRFSKGDKVITQFNQTHLAGHVTAADLATGTGGAVDGTLREYGAFSEQALVHMPENLTFEQAATLTCAGLTAWNALYGLEGRGLKPGDTVLVEGTGGVSIFALQFAKAAGCKVIATTSSAKKVEMLKAHGADHVINYKETTEWGEKAKELSKGGVDHLLEVAGPTTMTQALKAVRPEGVISIIGYVGGRSSDQEPSFLQLLGSTCTARGLVVGSRQQFEEMNRAVEANDIKPVIDSKTFKPDQVKEAYQYMWDQNHFGKVAITISD